MNYILQFYDSYVRRFNRKNCQTQDSRGGELARRARLRAGINRAPALGLYCDHVLSPCPARSLSRNNSVDCVSPAQRSMSVRRVAPAHAALQTRTRTSSVTISVAIIPGQVRSVNCAACTAKANCNVLGATPQLPCLGGKTASADAEQSFGTNPQSCALNRPCGKFAVRRAYCS